MNTNKLMLAALLAALALPALAEEAAPAEQETVARIVVKDGTPVHLDRNGSFQISGPGSVTIFPRTMAPRPIKNAPYSAQMITERQQNLSDGNQIAVQQSNLIYRDSAGRTRQEIRNATGELTGIMISDPVAGDSWILRPQDRTAMKIGLPAEARRVAEAARAKVEQMRKDGTLPTVERHKLEDGREEIIVKRVTGPNTGETAQIQKDVRIQVLKALETNGPQLRELQSRLAPLTAMAFGDAKWSSKAVTKDLGSREFNGVKAEGKLRTYEIPAGEIGNRNAIVVADETWYSPDLRVAVYTKHSDPRSGDVVFRLDGLKREEPAASLFAVPSDYTVKDLAADAKAKAQ